MITHTTLVALNLLSDIAYNEKALAKKSDAISPEILADLLTKMEVYGLIKWQAGQPRESQLSYTLVHPINEITLLEVLEATGQHLNCNHEADEKMYTYYSIAARKLGVINLITRKFLSEIKLIDLL